MGRSRLQRKVARGDENGGDENGYDSLFSLHSETRWSDGNPNMAGNMAEEVPTYSSKLEESLDALYEKRAATREAGLRGLISILSREVWTNYIANKYETLAHQILACLKKGGSSEIALATRALGLVVLTLGTGDATLRVKEEAEQCLLKAANLASASSARVAALDAVAVITFVCNVAQDTKDAMTFLWQIICHNAHDDQKLRAQKPPNAVIAAALSGWTLLLSSLPSYLISEPLLVSSLPVLSLLLQSADLAVRKAAGEAAAMLYETAPDCTDAENGNAETLVVEVETDEHLAIVSEDAKDVTKEQVMQEMLHEMKSLLVDNSKKFQTRKERVVQRKSFRQLLTTLDDGVPREVKVKIPGCKVLTINTWSDTVQLDRLKHYLGDSGFQAHMQCSFELCGLSSPGPISLELYVPQFSDALVNWRTCALVHWLTQGNTLLQEIFNVELEGSRVRVCDLKLNQIEKRMLFSPNSMASKTRTKKLNRTRLSKQSEKAASFNVNGYESD